MSPRENVSRIVDKTKELLEHLKIAVKHQSDLTTECTDSTVAELTKTVENLKSTNDKQEKELQNLKKQTEEARLRLNLSFEENQALKEKNLILRQAQDDCINQLESVDQNQLNLTTQRKKLRTSKWITGVRFDPVNENNSSSGYLAISAHEPPNNALIPFDIENDNPKKKEIIWKIIEETCHGMQNLIIKNNQ